MVFLGTEQGSDPRRLLVGVLGAEPEEKWRDLKASTKSDTSRGGVNEGGVTKDRRRLGPIDINLPSEIQLTVFYLVFSLANQSIIFISYLNKILFVNSFPS